MSLAPINFKDNHKAIITLNNNKKEVVEQLISLTQTAHNMHKYIMEASGTCYYETQKLLIANSDGMYIEDERTRTRLTIEILASNGTDQQCFSVSSGGLVGLELMLSANLEQLSAETVEVAINFLNAAYAPAGIFPVVIDNGFGAIIFHEACGHSLEATSIINNSSEFSNKINKPIASPIITLIDDGSLSNFWGSSNIDDEGTFTKRNILIENGILRSFLLDKLTAKQLGKSTTGSCRRESYKYCPTPRMTNTFIQNGTNTRDEVISSVEYGLLVRGVGGGSVNPANGEFNFKSNESYLIEGGKITKPLRGVTLIGKGSDALNKVEMIGNNLKFSQGFCGAASGTVPISVGQPTIKISQLMVGGKG